MTLGHNIPICRSSRSRPIEIEPVCTAAGLIGFSRTAPAPSVPIRKHNADNGCIPRLLCAFSGCAQLTELHCILVSGYPIRRTGSGRHTESCRFLYTNCIICIILYIRLCIRRNFLLIAGETNCLVPRTRSL